MKEDAENEYNDDYENDPDDDPDANGEEGDDFGEDFGEEEMLDIAEKCFYKIAKELLNRSTSVRQAFQSFIIS